MSDTPSKDAIYNWSPSRHAISFETFGLANETRRPVIVVSHPTAPFNRPLTAGGALSDDLKKVAHDYLVQLDKRLTEHGRGGLGLPAGWLEALDPTKPAELFGWLPVRPPFTEGAGLDPSASIASHRLLRKRSGVGSQLDETVILIAGERLLDGSPTRSGFGLRVVLHLRRHAGGGKISVNAMTAHLPHTPYLMLFELPKEPAFVAELEALMSPSKLQELLQGSAKDIAEAAQLDAGSTDRHQDGLVIDEYRFVRADNREEDESPIRLEVGGVGTSKLDRETSYRFRARLKVRLRTMAPIKLEMETIVSRRALATAVNARVFEQDAASWREHPAQPVGEAQDLWQATRPTRDLDRFRAHRVVPEALESASGDFRVRKCPGFVQLDRDNDPNDTRRVHEMSGGHPVRSNDQSAVGAYHNCDDVFAVMRGFGLEPKLYFRACQLPVNVFYRSGIRPGPGKNGRTINAWVRVKKPDASGFLSDQRPAIELHLALANLTRQWRDLNRPPKERWAEPLGIAASERWILHEFGHVLIAAVLGADVPEFLFAHSPGDGMAAVWADPSSRFGHPQTRNWERLRGYTFPWVLSARRHDRCVLNGWSWCGTFQRPVSEAPEAQLEHHKGYVSEQILSTTLFRLYRCLGGDTLKEHDKEPAPDIGRRLAASRVVLYLVMRAMEGFGHPPRRAEELEAAMIDADVGLTTPLTLERDPAYPYDRVDVHWVGGRAHKIIRWAFEAQGMHAPNTIRDAPGAPPPVDIYITDRRPAEEMTERGLVRHAPGGYPPVSLDWSPGAEWFNAGTDAAPQVGNRGHEPATNIKARLWVGKLMGDAKTDGWDTQENITWMPESAAQPPADRDLLNLLDELELLGGLPGGATRALPLLTLSPASDGEIFVLIELSCPDDRANTDPLAGLPTEVVSKGDLPRKPRELADLVATDNNLCLWRPFAPSPVAEV